MKIFRPADCHLPLQTASTANQSLLADFFFWLPLMLASWFLAWKFQDEFISDWDGFDYTGYAVQGLPSALGLGRSLFLGYNHALWKIAHNWFDVPNEQAYLVLRYGVIAQTGPAIVGIYALFKELSADRTAAFLGALLMAASPFYIIYSGRAMSEIPGFLVLSWSLWWMLRSLRMGKTFWFLLAALLAGLSANIREFAVFYLPFIALAPIFYRRKWAWGATALAAAIIGAFGGIIFWTIYSPELYWPATINWYTLSAHEREVHPVTTHNFRFLVDFSYNCSAAVTLLAPGALIALATQNKYRLLLLFGLLGLASDLVLLANHDLSVNPRYLLTGLLGLAPVCGWLAAVLIRAHGVWSSPLLIGLLVLTKGTYNNMSRELYNQEWAARAAKSYFAKIEKLPWHSAFIVGARSPLIGFYNSIGARPFWKTISSGAGWPDEDLDKAIDDLHYAGRFVYVDFDPELWQSGLREKNREAAGLEMIKRKFQLEKIDDSFYRIIKRKPETTDLVALDQ